MTAADHPSELAGWKQIARFLRVSEPTARRYYEELDLPVDDRNGRYFADPARLEEWRQERFGPSRPSRRDVGSSSGELLTAESLARRKRWLRIAVVAILGSSTLLFALHAFAPGPPQEVLLEGSLLVASDPRGRETWRRDLETLVPGVARVSKGPVLLEDFDGDGRNEVAVSVLTAAPKAETARLLALDDDGDLLWRFANGGELVVRGRRFEPVYGGNPPAWVESVNESWILNVAPHSIWYPTQVTLLDPATGEPELEYWHPGRVYDHDVFDQDQDGRSELVLGGINNPGHGIGHPSLAVLDLPRPGLPVPRSSSFFREGNPQEARYLLFPTYDVFEVQGKGAGVHLVEGQSEGRFLIGIGLRTNAMVFQTLDADLEMVDIRPSDGFLQEHERLYRQGLLDHPFSPDELHPWRGVVDFDSLPDGNSPEVRERFAAFPPTL